MRHYLSKITEFFERKTVRWTSGLSALFLLILVSFFSIPHPFVEGADSLETISKIGFNGPIAIHFSEKMNTKSVEENFQIYPYVSGDITWSTPKVLEYYPSQPLITGQEYRVTIKRAAKSHLAKKLQKDEKLFFIVAGPPYVRFASPTLPVEILEESPEIPTVNKDQTFTVLFDRPMEWSDPSTNYELEDLFIIEPKVEGKITWLGPRIMQFIPETLSMSTRYTITIPPGVSARDGGETESIFKWSVETPTLQVMESTPLPNTTHLSVATPIILRFNQPVDLNNIEPGANTLIFPSNDLDADKNPKNDGFFNTEVTYMKTASGESDQTVLIFEPTFPYQPETDYRFVLRPGLKALTKDGQEAPLLMKENFELEFTTGMKTGLAIDQPDEGAVDYTYDYVQITSETPLDYNELISSISVEPPTENNPNIVFKDDQKEAFIYYDFAPGQAYKFMINAPIKDEIGNFITETQERNFIMKSSFHHLKWATDENILFASPSKWPEVEIKTGGIKEVDIKWCPLSLQSLISTQNNPLIAQEECEAKTERFIVSPNSSGVAKLNINSLLGTPGDLGLYSIYISLPDTDFVINKTIMLSNALVYMDKYEEELQLWSVDISNGIPIEGIEASFYSHDGKLLKSGKTDEQGFLLTNNILDESIYVELSKGGKTPYYGLINEYWSPPILNNQNGDWVDIGENRILLQTDKTYYQAKDIIRFNGIIRKDEHALLEFPGFKEVIVSLQDLQENVLYIKKVSMRRNGSFTDEIEIAEDMKSGIYNLNVKEDIDDLSPLIEMPIQVMSNDPQLSFEWEVSDSHLLPEEEYTFPLVISYPSGAPVNSMSGEWKLYRQSYVHNYDPFGSCYFFDEWSYPNCQTSPAGGMVLVAKGFEETNKDGKIEIIIPKTDAPTGYRYHLVFQVTSNHFSFSKVQKSFVIHPAPYYVGLKAKHHILSPGDSIESEIVVMDLKQNVVTDKKVNISLVHDLTDEVLYEKWITPESDFKLSIPISSNMPGGKLKLIAEGVEVSRSVIPFVIIKPEANFGEKPLDLILDQPDYWVGGKMKTLLITPGSSPRKPATILLSYGRSESLGFQIFTVTNPYKIIEIPVTEKMVPNVYLSARMIEYGGVSGDGSYDKKDQEINALLLEQELNDLREEGGDSDKVQTLERSLNKVKNELNSSGDISLRVHNIKRSVKVDNPKKHIQIDVVTHPSSPRPGEKVSLTLRTYDYQNRPIPAAMIVKVNNQGDALTTDKLCPDQIFYQERVFQGQSSWNLAPVVSKEPLVSSYRSTSPILASGANSSAYYNALILTDETGQAEVDFTLPDEYSKWNIQAVATHEQDYFGYIEKPLIIQKRLVMEVQKPQFFVEGDETQIGVKLINVADEDVNTRIELITKDLQLDDNEKKNIFIKIGETKTVYWKVLIPKGLGNQAAKVTFRSREDFMEVSIPVVPNVQIQTLSKNNFFDLEKLEEQIKLSEDKYESQPILTLKVGAAPTHLIEKFILELHEKKSGTLEEKVSQLYADLLIMDIGASYFSSEFLSEEEQIKYRIQKTLNSIGKYQKEDGAFSMYQTSLNEDKWLTAYVLWVLSEAENQDFKMDKVNVDLAYTWLIKETPNATLEEQTFIMWVLTKYSNYDTKKALTL